MSTIIGFIGVGTVSEAVIHGLCAGEKDSTRLVLSPRSPERSRRLSERYDRCARVESNQAVVDAADIVVLAVLPQQADEVLASLTFRPDQTFVSFIGGARPSEWADAVSPVTRLCMAIPLPPAQMRLGPLLVCPPLPEVMRAFAGLGDLIPWSDEELLRVLSLTSAVMSSYFEAQNTVIDWAVSRGIDEATASSFVRSMLAGLAAIGQDTNDAHRAALPAEHQTPGGLNERVRAALLAAGVFDDLTRVLDEVYDHAVLR